ncbi:MAG: ABC transporter permease subunit [Streptosporangiales bacterium]|nr:ABC transporter permease subunit [Streptosporangiales bacterium]
MLIMYASMRAIPPSLYEAARLDGASEWSIAWRIKVPIIAPAIVLTAVFSIIGTVQLFTEPQVMTTVSTSITSAYTPSMAAYAEISAQNYGLGAARPPRHSCRRWPGTRWRSSASVGARPSSR